jgi:hypothetical protein
MNPKSSAPFPAVLAGLSTKASFEALRDRHPNITITNFPKWGREGYYYGN